MISWRKPLLSLVVLSLMICARRTAHTADAGSLVFSNKGHVVCGDILNVPEGTIEFWFKPASMVNNEWILSKRKDAANQMTLGFGTVGIMYMVKKDGEWSYAWVNRDQIAPDEWHHLACTFSKSRATLFLDGAAYPKNMHAGEYGLEHLAGGELRIGQGTADIERYNGLLGPVRFSDTIRYTADFTPSDGPFKPDANTIAIWNLGEETGAELRDASGKLPPARIVGAVARSTEIPGGRKLIEGVEFGILPVLRTKQPPAIDGDPDDACWKSAAVATGFVTVGSGGWTVAPKQTSVRFVYDDRNLYLSAVCLEPQMDKANAGVTARDGAVFDDDCLELFFDVNNDRSSYYQYAVNALGAYYDGFKLDKSWNSTIQVSGRKLNDRWLLEAAIPFDQLKTAPPKEGTLWGFNAAREHRAGSSVDFSTWSALPGRSFHAPAEFARLRFAGDKIPGSLEYSNLKPAIRNPSFSEIAPNGKPLHWTLGPNTRAQETAYLAGLYHLVTDADDLMARQETGFRNVAGRKYELTVSARGENGAQLSIMLLTEKENGEHGSIVPIRDQPVSAAFETSRVRVSIPDDVRRVTAVELHRSGGKGTLVVKEIGLADLAEFREVREAAAELPAHRLPVGDPFVSPSIPWGTPLAGGPLNALIIVEAGGNREAVELAERLEIKSDIVWIADGTPFAYGAAKINARLGRKEAPYEVIILGAALRNEKLGRAVRDNAAAGTGLVCIQMDGDDTLARGIQSALPKRTDLTQTEPDIARSIPWRWLPTVATNYIDSGRAGQPSLKSMGIGSIEKGRVVALGCGAPGGTRGILPRAANNYSDLDQWWEYFYALVGKSALRVSGRAMPASIDSCTADLAKGTVTVSLAGKPGFAGTLRTAWSDKYHVADGYEKIERVAIAEGGNAAVSVKIPDAAVRSRGVHVLQLFLRDADGKSVDWSSTGVPVEGTARLAERNPFPQGCYTNAERLEGVVSIENAARLAGLTVKAELIDAYDRVVWAETRPVLPGGGEPQLSFAPALDRVMTVYHAFCATLSDQQGVLDRRSWPVYLRDRWSWVTEDFRAGIACDYFWRVHTDREFAKWFQGFGMKFTSEGGSYDAGPRDDMPWDFMNLNWQPFHHFSKNPVREPCLSDPAVIEEIVNTSIASYGNVRRYAPTFCAMGDESELVRDGTAEVCFCPKCAARFRQWAHDAYGTLDKVNAEWGTAFKNWDEIAPIRADEARARGNPAQWQDFRTCMEDIWIGCFAALKNGVKQKYPDAVLGFTNPFILDPFNGEDHYKSAITEDIFSKYARTDLTKEIQSFNPKAQLHTYYGYLENLSFTRWYPWWFAFNGGDYLVWWSALRSMQAYDLFDITGRHTARSLATVETIQDLVHGIGKVVHEYPLAKDAVVIFYSQSSMHCAWIESDMKVGDAPWASAGMDTLPVSNPFGLNYKSRDNFKGLLKENGVQPDFLVAEQVEAGKLAGRRLLILPCVSAISDATLARIEEFVRNGGTVVADLRLGVYSEHGKPLAERPVMERLFGLKRSTASYKSDSSALAYQPGFAALPSAGDIDKPMGRESIALTTGAAMARFADGSPAVVVNPMGKGKSIYLNFVPGFGVGSQSIMAAVLDMAGVERPVRLVSGEKAAFGYETFRFERGPIRFIGVLRDMPPLAKGERSSWANALFLNALQEKQPLTVKLPQACHVYNVRTGKYFGRTADVALEMAQSSAAFLALLPYQVRELAGTSAKPAWRPGETADFAASVMPVEGRAGDHVLRVETLDPEGKVVAHYSKNVLAAGGQCVLRIPLALNERPGAWKVRLTDVASGASKEIPFRVEE